MSHLLQVRENLESATWNSALRDRTRGKQSRCIFVRIVQHDRALVRILKYEIREEMDDETRQVQNENRISP